MKSQTIVWKENMLKTKRPSSRFRTLSGEVTSHFHSSWQITWLGFFFWGGGMTQMTLSFPMPLKHIIYQQGPQNRGRSNINTDWARIGTRIRPRINHKWALAIHKIKVNGG